jgi:hypothetical protein
VMAVLTLTLAEDEIRVILDRDIVTVQRGDDPELDGNAHEVAKRIADATPNVPFALTIDEAKALFDGIANRPTDEFTEEENDILQGILGPLDYVD